MEMFFLGRNAGSNISGSNRLAIDNTNTNSPLLYGEFDNDIIRINGNLEVTGDLDISGTNNTTPIGTIQMWPTSTAPDGWLICNGTTFDASSFPETKTPY